MQRRKRKGQSQLVEASPQLLLLLAFTTPNLHASAFCCCFVLDWGIL